MNRNPRKPYSGVVDYHAILKCLAHSFPVASPPGRHGDIEVDLGEGIEIHLESSAEDRVHILGVNSK